MKLPDISTITDVFNVSRAFMKFSNIRMPIDAVFFLDRSTVPDRIKQKAQELFASLTTEEQEKILIYLVKERLKS